MKKVEILSKLEAAGVIAVVRGKNKDEAIKAINSIIAGGIKGIELTFTVPNAEEIIKEIAKKYADQKDVIIGAGTVLDAFTARIAIMAGAEYIVSPSFDRQTAEICNLYQIPLTLFLSKKYGKKELASVGMFFSAIVYLILFLIKTSNMYVFLILSSVGYMGLGVFNTVIWANITDVIDDQEVKSDQREDGTVYAVYSFARKIGQALAGGVGGWTLSIIGYDSLANIQTGDVLEKLYNASTLIPSICFFIVGLILFFLYPLSKDKVLENCELLKQKYK